jgi:predicted peroxiredoxin
MSSQKTYPMKIQSAFLNQAYFSIFLQLMIISCFELQAQTEIKKTEKMQILIHVTTGPENPTRAALAFLIAKTAVDEGHLVTLFLAGDAVQLFRNDVLDNLSGLGTGKLRDHFDAIVKGGGKFYLSGMSSKVRGVQEEDLKDKHAEFALPQVLLRLSLESDRMFVY